MKRIFAHPCWLERKHAIVKYSPKYFVKNRYVRDEWTSISDIGKSFSGIVLSEQEYIRIEQSYLLALLDIIAKLGVAGATLNYLEIWEEDFSYLKDTSISESLQNETRSLHHNATKLRKNSCLSISDIIDLTKLGLRELAYFEISNKDLHFGVEVGYDFYMYVYSDLDILTLNEISRRHGLFVNPR